MLRQAQPEPLKLQKLLFHFWIVLSIGLPRTVHRLLVKLADLLIEIVQRRHLLPFRRRSHAGRAYREFVSEMLNAETVFTRPPWIKHASNSSIDQGGGKRRASGTLTRRETVDSYRPSLTSIKSLCRQNRLAVLRPSIAILRWAEEKTP